MLKIEQQVVVQAIYENGRWLFQGKGTHAWLVEAEGKRRSGQRNDADEAYLISGTLQGLDNNE